MQSGHLIRQPLAAEYPSCLCYGHLNSSSNNISISTGRSIARSIRLIQTTIWSTTTACIGQQQHENGQPPIWRAKSKFKLMMVLMVAQPTLLLFVRKQSRNMMTPVHLVRLRARIQDPEVLARSLVLVVCVCAVSTKAGGSKSE